MNRFQQAIDAFRSAFSPVSPVPYDTPRETAEKLATSAFNQFVYNPEEKKMFPQSALHGLMQNQRDAIAYRQGQISREEYLDRTIETIKPEMLMLPVSSTRFMGGNLLKAFFKQNTLPEELTAAGRSGRVIRENLQKRPNQIGVDARTGARMSQPVSTRQRLLSDAWRKKNFTRSQSIIDLMDNTDPLKEVLQKKQNALMKNKK